jgi:hypothetical protein
LAAGITRLVVRTMFATYAILIVLGITVYTIIGITQH